MNSLRTVFLSVALFAGVSAAQTPAAGTVTAIDAGARLTDDAGVTLTPTVGVNAHEGFCGLFARQAETTAGLVLNVEATEVQKAAEWSSGIGRWPSAGVVPGADQWRSRIA